MSEEGGVVLLSSSKKEREAYENYAGVAKFYIGTHWIPHSIQL